MNTNTHLEAGLQRDLNRLRATVQEMSDLASQAVEDSVAAMLKGDRQLAYTVILRDQLIDERENELDRLCLEFLVRQQPTASLLRFAYGIIKVNLELERVGDYAESIAHQSLKLNRQMLLGLQDRFKEIGEMSVSMLRAATQAFAEQNVELARRTIHLEQEVDLLKSCLINDLTTLYREEALAFEALNPLMMIARRLEHVSDQARNICMEAIYTCTGEPVRHQGSEAFRILFVDNHNSGPSILAEAAAAVLAPEGFIFSSAGLDPHPITASTVAFLNGIGGCDAARFYPKSINQVPHLDHYQVIIGLDKHARQAFPPRPQKLVFLEWPTNDPAELEGEPLEVKAAHEAVFKELDAHLRDLVFALAGKPKGAKT